MVTNDLGACEWFVWDLRRSGLIDRGQLDSIVGEFLKRNPRAEAAALSEYLVNQKTLTAFQAERILSGKTQGLVLGPYVLLDAVGQGSMGQVYKATSKNDNYLYAVKVLPRRSMWNVRLARRQVRSFGQFAQAAVVPFVDVGTAGGLHYLTWPLVEGQTLESIVQQSGRLSPQQTVRIGYQVAQGLATCHQNNIFHGLLKPSNIMVGSDGQARILDFGIGCLLVENEGESLVDTMSTANTLTSGLDCASPESIMEPTNRTPAGDQYSLGCVLYYCLTGRVPFPEGSAVEKMMAHQTKEPVPLREFAPDVSEALAKVIARLMAKKPEDRYSGTDEVVEALEPHLVGGVPVPTPQPPAVAGGRGAGRSSHVRPGLGGSSPKMPGVAPAPVPVTPARATAGLPPTPVPAARLNGPNGPVAPNPRNNNLPSRASFTPAVNQSPQSDYDVALSALPLQDLPPGYNDPAALRASAGWVSEGAYLDERRPTRTPSFGTFGIVAAALLLMALAYLGARFLMG
jgi:serine/threonine-protein kinase